MHDHFITSDPGGRPVIAGTHVTVEAVLKELAASDAVDALLAAHPELNRDAIHVALHFAAERLPIMEPVPEELPPAEAERFIPRTEFGKRMWELHQAAVEEARQRGEPLLDLEGIRREVRERRGERDVGEAH